MPERVAIVGAGMAGLSTARELTDAQRPVVVLEQDAHVGGRLATRRLGDALFDHGAQFFTVREGEFGDLVERWRSLGVPVTEWCRGFARCPSIEAGPEAAEDATDGHPRYMVDGGMATLGRTLAEGLDVRTGQRVTKLRAEHGGWELSVDDGGSEAGFQAETVVLTPPAPAAQQLLGETLDVLQVRVFAPTVALLVSLDGPSKVPEPGGVAFARGPVRWLADNAMKGISEQAALTVHASEEESHTLLEANDEMVRSQLWPLLAPWFGDASPVETAVVRWRHARPIEVHNSRAVVRTIDRSQVVLAGDAFGGPRVEGAALSGLAAAALA